MKKIFVVGFIVCSSIFLSSCTLIQNLMIVNSSSEEIEIRYEKKDYSSSSIEVTSERNFNAWGFLQQDWDKMPTERYNFSEDKRTVTVKMMPHEVIKVGYGDPYYLDKGDYEHFNLVTLKIKGSNKEIYFDNISKLLSEFKKNDYKIIYR